MAADASGLEAWWPWLAFGAWALAGILWIGGRRQAAAMLHALVALAVLVPFAQLLRNLVQLARLHLPPGEAPPRAFIALAAAPVAGALAALGACVLEWRGRRWAAVAAAFLTAAGVGLMLLLEVSVVGP